MATFGDLLRRHRIRAGLSQEELAERSGLSIGGVSALERGVRRRAYRGTIVALAKALALPAQDLAEFEKAAIRGRGREAAAVPIIPALPHELTSLVGRDPEVAKIVSLLEERALVTVTGAGGIGKTRVAIAVGARLQKVGETRFVDLAPLTDSAYTAQAIASAFELQLHGERDEVSALCALLRSKSALVILDNCEHVLHAVAKIATAVLRQCSGIRLICTSRERIGIGGEAVYQLSPLSLASAVELFEDRTLRHEPTFQFDAKRRLVAADVCAALDNLPLAIELAAAQASILGLENIRDRLHSALFSSDNEAAPSRHRSISSAIAWSVELLNATDRSLLYGLSAFTSSFGLESAEEVCRSLSNVERIAPSLARLVSKSLVIVDRSREPHAFRLLEPIRAFARAQLLESSAFGEVLTNHASWIAAIGARTTEKLLADPNSPSFYEVQSHHNDLRAALEWALDARCLDVCLAARIVGHFRVFWILTGNRRECRRYGFRALERAGNSCGISVLAALYRALIQCTKGEQMLKLADCAISTFEQAGDAQALAGLQGHLIYELAKSDRLHEAEVAALAAERIFNASALEGSPLHALFLHNRGHLRIAQRRLAEAERDLVSSQRIYERITGDSYQPGVVIGLAELFHCRGDTARAATYAREARIHGRVGDARFAHLVEAAYRLELGDLRTAALVVEEGLSAGQFDSIESILLIHIAAALAARTGHASQAAKLCGFVDEALHAETYSLDFPNTHVRGSLNASLAGALNGNSRATLERSGKDLSANDAVRLALALLKEPALS